jgi:phosphopantothenoylcysteine synthetase/decarboxylase
MTSTHRGVLYVIVCGAGPAVDVDRLVQQAKEHGWDVCLIATPAALDFIDAPKLERLTARRVRSQYRKPGDGIRSLPQADAIIIAPATYNTINKWASGISDTYALGLLAEALGLGVPIVVLPFVNAALASHFAYERSVRDLRGAGVSFILERDPHAAGIGSALIATFPWHIALEEVDNVLTVQRTLATVRDASAKPSRPS